MSLRTRVSVASLALLVASPLFAQPPSTVTLPSRRAEVDQVVPGRMSAIDSNRDGFLSADELGDGPPAEVDTDHDGKLSFAEVRAGLLMLFDFVDANHDGVLNREERASAADRMNQAQTPANPQPN